MSPANSPDRPPRSKWAPPAHPREDNLYNQRYPLALLADKLGDLPSRPPWRYHALELALPLGGRTIEAQVLAAEAPARLSDVVPLARSLATLISRTVLNEAVSAGNDASCRKGCSHCCKHLVPVSGAEAFRLFAEVQSLPDVRRHKVMGRFTANARRIIQAGPPEVPEGTTCDEDGATISPAGACGHWYADLQLTCPLADGDLCSMYEQRPIACREHMVTSNSLLCKGFQPGRGQILPVPVSMLDALAALSAKMMQRPVEAIIMSLTPAWAQANRRHQKRWPATELAASLLEITRHLAAPHADHSAA